MRLVERSAMVVPFRVPTVPFSAPSSRLPGPSKLAKFSMLNADTLGSKMNRSPTFSGLDSVRSNVRSHARLGLSAGAGVMAGESAPNWISWDRESKPVVTSACPAGVNWLPKLEL